MCEIRHRLRLGVKRSTTNPGRQTLRNRYSLTRERSIGLKDKLPLQRAGTAGETRMWCRMCQQDVPAIALAAGDSFETEYCCARCNQLFDKNVHTVDEEHVSEPIMTDGDTSLGVRMAPPVDFDDWGLDLESMDAERLLVAPMPAQKPVAQTADPAHDLAADWHLGGMLTLAPTPTATPASSPQSITKRDKPRTSVIGWLLILFGVTAFVCGGVLMGLSIAQGRSELWRMGMPLALVVGQGGLLVGLILQLERVWQSHRKASARLNEVDEHVADLQTTADLLGTTHSGPSQAFYHHMASGANTEMMLADLKGQMDMLAAQMVRSRR